MNSEVLIVGGGVIGLNIARELCLQGVRKITIVDRGRVGGEASWAAAGMLAPNIETDSSEEFHRLGIESLELFPALSDALFEETSVDIELDRSGTLCLAFDDNEAAQLAEIYGQQISRNVSVDQLSGEATSELEPAISTAVRSSLLYPHDWQVENRKLVAALRRFAELNGVQIIEDVEVSELVTSGRSITGVRTQASVINAGVTVLATGAWTSLIKIDGARMPFDVRPVRGQMISFETGSRTVRRVVYSQRGYVVPRADGRVLVGATVEDVGFDKRTTNDGAESLASAGIEIVPQLGGLTIADQWAGLRPFAGDGLPVIGGLPGYENVLVATAHYRNGILLAPKTAEMIAGKIVDGVESEYFGFFSVDRFAALAATRN